MVKSLHCVISGKVQGVNFRADTQSYASSFGITGWVRNISEGKVEVLAQGDTEKFDELKKFLLRGSPLSRIEKVECEQIDYDKAYSTFEIR